MMHGASLFGENLMTQELWQRRSVKNRRSPFFKKSFLCVVLSLMSPVLGSSCPDTTPWSAPVNVSNSGNVTSSIFSAATSAGFMAVWADSSNNANYSFSSDGASWQSGLVTPAVGDVAPSSDVFVAGNASGFLVAWMDSSNNGWSSFSANNGSSWSPAIQINGSLALDPNADIYVSAGTGGFVATMIAGGGFGSDNAYVSFSTGTSGWSIPTQVTTDGSVSNYANPSTSSGRGFVCADVVGNTCMLTWLTVSYSTASAFFTSINPFSSTTVYPIVSVGYYESAAIVASLNGYYMETARANISGTNGVNNYSVCTSPANWAAFSVTLSTAPRNPGVGPWVAANPTGFMSSWAETADQASYPGTPMWIFSSNNGFNWTPVCSILQSPSSTTILGPVGLSGNYKGFVSTWVDSADSNAYASFYSAPSSTGYDVFVELLQQKYGPLL